MSTTISDGPTLANPLSEESTAEEKIRLAERIAVTLEDQLLTDLSRLAAQGLDDGALRGALRAEALRHCNPSERIFSPAERNAIIDRAVDGALGWGPFERLWRDASVDEILVNGPREVFVDRQGRLERADFPAHHEASLRRCVARCCARAGRLLAPQTPMVDVTLPDGSRMRALLAPFAAAGTMIALRRAPARPATIQELGERGVASVEMFEFLAACVKARLNIVIAGPVGSGKTALLSALARVISPEERVATVERSPELRLPSGRTLSLVAAPAEGRPAIEVRDLLAAALLMRPDRLLLGECQGAETGDFLDALAAGRDGAMTTIVAPSIRDALTRLETLALRSHPGTLPHTVRHQMLAHTHMIVLMGRQRSGASRVMAIHEVANLEGESLTTLELFRLLPSGPGGLAQSGEFECCGNTPNCWERLRSAGPTLSSAFFHRRVLGAASENFSRRIRE